MPSKMSTRKPGDKDDKKIDKMITSLTPKARRSLIQSLLTSLQGDDVEFAAELITKKKKETKAKKSRVKDDTDSETDSDSSDTSSSECGDSNHSKTNGTSSTNGENTCYPMDPPSSPIISIPKIKSQPVRDEAKSPGKKVLKSPKVTVENEPLKPSLTTDEESEDNDNCILIIPRTNIGGSLNINESSIDDSTEEEPESKKAANVRVILYNSTKKYSSNTHTQSSVSRPHVQEKRDRVSSNSSSTDDESPRKSREPGSKSTSINGSASHDSNQPEEQSNEIDVEDPDSSDASKRTIDPSYVVVDSDPRIFEENLSNSAMEQQHEEDQETENETNLDDKVLDDNETPKESIPEADLSNEVPPNDASASVLDIDNSENDTIGPANSDNESVLTLGTDSISESASSFTESDDSDNGSRTNKKKNVNKSKKVINKKVKSDQSNSAKTTAASEVQQEIAEENSCSTSDTTHTNSIASFVINDKCLSSVASVQIVRLPQELVESTASANSIQRRVRQMENDVFKDLDLRWCKQASRPVNRSKMTPSRKVIDSDSDNSSDDEAWIPNKASTSKGIKKTRSSSSRYNWTVIESSDSSDEKPIQRARRTRRTRGKNDQEAGPSEEKKSNAAGGSRKKRNRVVSSEDESQISTDNEIVKSDPDEILDSGTDEDNRLLKKETPKPKSKRRRVVTLSSDEDDKSGKKKGKGRKNIKKLLTEKELKEETRAAGQREKERIQRIAERQKLYNEFLLNEMKINPEKPSRLILEIDPDTREPIVEVAPELAKQMKSHQVKGIRFMWDSVIESVHKAKEDGSGCILAHSMGLGKTFQIITFLHTILTHRLIKKHIKHALVICPVNTIKNWISEFRQWLEDDGLLEFPLFDLSDSKSQLQRGETFKLWRQRGGVLICGITLFATLVSPKGKKPKCPKWVRDIISEALIEPGPDIVVIDEGHVLKNSQTAVNKAVNSISTLRRIILTGTPLQNNLDEYHVMVHFVKPNLLGTKKEFTNRFVNPITNGQHIDSTPGDVVVMKKRVHVLHKLLDGCVQRFDYSVLKPYLQPKLEFIVSIKLTEKQIELYRYYLDNMSAREGSALLADFANLRLIWNHPALLYSAHTKRREAEAKRNEKDFVTTEEEESMSESDSDVIIESDKEVQSGKKKAKNGVDNNSNSNSNSNGGGEVDGASDNEVCKKWTSRTRSAKSEAKIEEPQLPDNDPETQFKNCWFYNLLPFMEMDKLEWSSKMIVLFYILDECEKIGDKVIVFTQSLDTLDFIETCLESRAREMESTGNSYSWRHGSDYFRIDGSVSGGLRKSHIDIFNNPDNLRARLFLLSTKAGGLGINLVGANRCIIFDASWNPTHDIQAIFRIYRFGQIKPVFIYRFIAQGTMEEKIYERQVYKQSLSVRVIDELQVGRHFRAQDLQELYKFEPDTREERPILNVPKDRLLADLIVNHKDLIVKYHEHDSLLENRPEEDLTEDERKSA
ncbi:transcriptional regulator ATRX homolog, partial [Tetranychus urticae]|uniref:transcriptional regulator ATRX homolog n=1 Tax=Tetranychus urticae TaxID=32264 RepID=UPI00077BA642